MSDDGFELDLDFGFDGALSLETNKIDTVLAMLEGERTQDALDVIQEIRDEDGATPLVRHLLALVAVRLERSVSAVRQLQDAHKDAPEAFEHVEVLASLLAQLGQRADSVYYAKLATALQRAYPEHDLVPSWLTTFGVALMKAEANPLTDKAEGFLADGNLTAAAHDFADAVELDPTDARAWRGLIAVNRRRHRPGDCLRAAEALVEVAGDDPQALLDLAQCQTDLGLIQEAWESANDALALAGPDPAVAHVLPGLVAYDPSGSPELAQQLAAAWNTMAAIETEPIKVTPRRSDKERIRIGILSGAIRAGSSQAPVLSTFEECIGRAADLHFYINSGQDDVVANRLRRSAARWRDISRIDDDTVAAMMRNDELQVLIDLDGFDWLGRPSVVARKPAPVVLSAFREPGAVPGANHGILAMGEPNLPGFREARPDVAQTEEGLSTWPLYIKAQFDEARRAVPADTPARIFIDAPASRLSAPFLKRIAAAVSGGMRGTLTLRGDGLNDEVATEFIEQRFKDGGLDLGTVNRVPPTKDLESLISQSDLVLDTIPRPSAEAAIVALRQTVPVLTCRPKMATNGLVVSLLESLGFNDWIAEDDEDFSQKLVSWTAEPDRLRAVSGSIQEAVSGASGLDVRLKRGRAWADLFDHLLSKAAEETQ